MRVQKYLPTKYIFSLISLCLGGNTRGKQLNTGWHRTAVLKERERLPAITHLESWVSTADFLWLKARSWSARRHHFYTDTDFLSEHHLQVIGEQHFVTLNFRPLEKLKKKIKLIFIKLVTSAPSSHLIIQVARVPFVVLITAVLYWRIFPLHIITQITLKDIRESNCRQHTDHRSQSEHQTNHHTSKVNGTDCIQSNCRGKKRNLVMTFRK